MLNAIQSRRSIRRYADVPVDDAAIHELLEAARWAPSAHNRQPWRFCIVRSVEAIRRLASAMNDRLRADLAADGVPQAAIETDAARSFTRITSAPVVIVLCLTMADMDVYPDALRAASEHTMAVQSTAMAGQNLLLAAHALNLGACWMCAPLFCPDVVAASLTLPADWEPQALITVGVPAETREKSRHPLEQRTLWR
jgi:F420 biosynthesis protein FbiB-like protein